MNFFSAVALALKNIWRQRLRSALTIFAVIIGAISVISMVSIVLGASNVFLQQISSTGALTQVTVVGVKDATSDDIQNGHVDSTTGVKMDDTTVTKVKALPHVIDATAIADVYPLQTYRLKDDTSGKKYSGYTQGYTPGLATDKQLQTGRNLTASDGVGTVLIDSGVATKLGYKNNPQDLLGKTILFTTDSNYSGLGATIVKPPEQQPGQPGQPPQPQGNPGQTGTPTEISATIVGVTAPGGFGNGSDFYIPLSWAKGLLTSQRYGQDEAAMQKFQQDNQAYQQEQQRLQQEASQNHKQFTPAPQPTQPPMVLQVDSQLTQQGYRSILAKVDDAKNVDTVASEVHGINLGAGTAKEFLDTILRLFKIIGLVFGLIGAISLMVAAIGVVNTMVMATLERTREIGVMRACGATASTVRSLFTIEAALLGFWGGVFGVVLGIGLLQIANIVATRVLSQQHISVTNIVSMPIWLAFAVIGVTTIVGMLAGLYPAHRAAKLNPVDALRYE